MQPNTITQLKKLEQAMQEQYGVASVAEQFSVSPTQAQKIIAAAKEESTFLNRINVITVKNQKGQAIGINATGMIAGTTDTSVQDRLPRDPHSLGGTDYLCEQVNFDTFIAYAVLDAWAHRPEFQELVAKQTRKQISLNMITIGWWGASRAATSDPVANPKGQDVAKGWLKKIEEQAPQNFITEGATAAQIRIGEGGDYVNLDAAVNDIKNLIEPEHEDDGDLVTIIGRELLSYATGKFYDEHAGTPSEKGKIEERQVIGTYGGLPAFKVPGFPERGILVTSFDNLSIYIQEDSIRRYMTNNPKRDRYETYQSQNMDYVIEELGKVAAVAHANVKVTNDQGTTWE